MDLLDIIDGINKGPGNPSVHECREAAGLIDGVGNEILEFHGFKFKNEYNSLCGDGCGVGEIIFSDSSATVVKWQRHDFYAICKPKEGYGLTITDATIHGSVVGVGAIEVSTITGNVEVYGETLDIDGDVTVVGSVFTHTEKVIIRQLYQDISKLTIKSVTDDYARVTQPAIGPCTHDNMSYGRWTPVSPGMCLNTIHISGVVVVIESKSDFTIGSYGYDRVPAIVEYNGNLKCPERTGYRHLVYRPLAPEGSTKIEGYCKYVVSQDEGGRDIELPDEYKDLIEDIKKLNPAVANHITIFNPLRNLRSIKKLLELNPEINVELLLKPKAFSNIASAECCCILGMPADSYCETEILWMESKCTYLLRKAGFTQAEIDGIRGFSSYLAKYARELYGDNIDNMTPFQVRYIYEMIPEYEFYFSGKSKEECVKEFLQIQ